MRISIRRSVAFALLVTSVSIGCPAFADKPEGAGKGHSGKNVPERYKGEPSGDYWKGDVGRYHGKDYRRGDQGSVGVNIHFTDQQRIVVRDYYDERFRSGHCPPGLAKKHNGCLPPGQAKKWRIGRPLPRNVIYYELPSSIGISLGIPPVGYKYVRVANDILLIAIGSGMVMDAIQDLGRW